MSTDNPTTAVDDADPDVDATELQALRERVEELEESMAAVDTGDDQKKTTIVGRYFGLDTSGSAFYLAAWERAKSRRPSSIDSSGSVRPLRRLSMPSTR